MFKKLMLLSVLLISSVFLTSCGRYDKLSEISVELAHDYLNLYKQSDKMFDLDEKDSKYVDNKLVYKDFVDKVNELESLNKVVFNVDEYYNTYYNEDSNYTDKYSSSFDAEDINDENYYNPKQDSSLKQGDLDYDKRIKKVNGVNIIECNDLDFSNGSDIIAFNGVQMKVTRDDITETYDMIKKNPKYTFKYIDHRIDKKNKCIYVQFKSLYDENYKEIIKLSISKGKIVSIGNK